HEAGSEKRDGGRRHAQLEELHRRRPAHQGRGGSRTTSSKQAMLTAPVSSPSAETAPAAIRTGPSRASPGKASAKSAQTSPDSSYQWLCACPEAALLSTSICTRSVYAFGSHVPAGSLASQT